MEQLQVWRKNYFAPGYRNVKLKVERSAIAYYFK